MKKNQHTVSRKFFTIAEVMMVVAICIIVLAVSMSAWLNPAKQANLKNSARLVSNQLNLARAKAVAERKNIGVYFNTKDVGGDPDEKKPDFSMLICENGDPDKPLQGEHWLHLPGSIIFTTEKPTASASDMSWNSSKGDSVVFKRDGSITTDLEIFYLVPADQDAVKLDEAETHYYKIQLNTFTGHYKITLHEIE